MADDTITVKQKIRVTGDWQPAYMDSPPETKTEDFDTIDSAREIIDKWRKSACTVRVERVCLIEEYIWGEKRGDKSWLRENRR